jgi:hypothetical protein
MREYWPEKRLIEKERSSAMFKNFLQFTGTATLIGLLGFSAYRFNENRIQQALNSEGVMEAVRADYALQAMNVAVEMDSDLRQETQQQLSNLEKKAQILKENPQFQRYISLKQNENLIKYGIIATSAFLAYIAFVQSSGNALRIYSHYSEKLKEAEKTTS